MSYFEAKYNLPPPFNILPTVKAARRLFLDNSKEVNTHYLMYLRE